MTSPATITANTQGFGVLRTTAKKICQAPIQRSRNRPMVPRACLPARCAAAAARSAHADGGQRGNFVILPALTEAKLALYQAMRAARVGKAELGRRLNWHLPQLDRLLDLRHASRLDQLEAAFQALGKRLSVEIHEAA